MTEANKLEIPVIGTGDTNVDPDELDFIIPANDDAIRSIRLLCSLVADAAIEGMQERSSRAAEPEPEAVSAEPEYEEAGASDALVAALAGGGALSFEPDLEEDELLPGARPRPRPPPRRPRRPRPTRSPPSSRVSAPRPRRRPPADAPRRHAPDAPRREPANTGGPNPRHHPTGAGHHMADISAEKVKELRERTGAGFMDCKRALQESDGDVEKAVASLRERGLAAAAKKAGREAREGLVSSYIHTGGRVGVLIEVNCETDFVARTDEFQKLVRDLAVQVAGMAPLYVDVERIPEADLEAKKRELAEDESVQKKPENIRAADRRGPAPEVVLPGRPVRAAFPR